MTITDRLRRSTGFTFDDRPRLKIGDRVETLGGLTGEVAGVGLVDFDPHGPAYEVVEVKYDQPAARQSGLHYGVDLRDEDDDGS